MWWACIDQLFVLTTIIKQGKVRNLPKFACMIDFEKAFDNTGEACFYLNY